MGNLTESRTYSDWGYHFFGMKSPEEKKDEADRQAEESQRLLDQAKTSTPTPVMPSPDDNAVQEARRRSLTRQRARRGRQSTILTDSGDDTLG